MFALGGAKTTSPTPQEAHEGVCVASCVAYSLTGRTCTGGVRLRRSHAADARGQVGERPRVPSGSSRPEVGCRQGRWCAGEWGPNASNPDVLRGQQQQQQQQQQNPPASTGNGPFNWACIHCITRWNPPTAGRFVTRRMRASRVSAPASPAQLRSTRAIACRAIISNQRPVRHRLATNLEPNQQVFSRGVRTVPSGDGCWLGLQKTRRQQFTRTPRACCSVLHGGFSFCAYAHACPTLIL